MKLPKKIAILLGSPRKNGNSEQMAIALAKGAAEAGYTAQTVRLHGLKLSGCIDCRRCWQNGTHCFLNDDMKEVYAAIDDAEVIVFASPLYFYSWSAQIKPVWDRLLPYYAENSKVDVRGRRSVLLATAGDTEPGCFEGLKKSYELACGYCKWDNAGTILAYDVYTSGEIAAKGDWLAQAEQLGKKL